MLTSPKILWPAVDHNIFHQSRIGNNISRKLVSLKKQSKQVQKERLNYAKDNSPEKHLADIVFLLIH